MANVEQNVYVNNVFDAEDIEEENVDYKSIDDRLPSAQDDDEIMATSHNAIMESKPNVYVNNVFDAEDIEEENVDDKSIDSRISSAQDDDEITATSHNAIMESKPNVYVNNVFDAEDIEEENVDDKFIDSRISSAEDDDEITATSYNAIMESKPNVYVNNVFDAEDIEEENVDDKSIDDRLSSAQDNDEITATSHNTIIESTPTASFDNPVRKQQVPLRPLLLILVCILVTAVLTYFATKHICSENWNSQTECSTACGYSGTIYSQACFKEVCAGDGEQIDMRFSRTGLYYAYYISDDDKTLSNVKTAETSYSSSARFFAYKGAISDSIVDANKLIYYEVNYAYTVRYAVADVLKILQVGIDECSRVNAFFQTEQGWSFIIDFNNVLRTNLIRLYATQNGKNVKDKILSRNYMFGRKIRGQFKVFINTHRGEFTVIHNNESPLYVFKEVKSNETLCPIFGVFEPQYVDTQLKILNSRNFSRYPW